MRSLSAARAVDVRPILRPDRAALIQLLRDLPPAAWSTPTVCAGWDVHDVALHILGGDLSNISRRRDGRAVQSWGPGEDRGTFLAAVNQEWVTAARRLSPRLVVELLDHCGPLLFSYFDTLDLAAFGGPVSWAGSGPAPVWLDVAREYMERWVHQQHIRDAVGRPGQQDSAFVAPVIAASMHALPVALAQVRASGSSAVVVVGGEAGGEWSVVQDGQGRRLLENAVDHPAALVRISADDWWRLVTLGVTPDDVRARAHVEGDPELVTAILRAVAIIA